MAEQEIGQQVIANREHISPTKTGDNIAAKRVANYGWGPNGWIRLAAGPAGLVTTPWDYLAYTATSSTVDTYQFYLGGSGGTLQATLTITYTDTTKSQISSLAKT